jgi:hypothetical protein
LSAEHNLHGHDSSCASVNNHTQIIAGIAPWLNPSFSSRSGSSSTTLGACWPSWRWPRCTGCAESGRGTLSTLELRTCFELPATHGWAAQLYLHPTTDRLGSPAAPPSTATGDPLITAAAIGRYRGLSLCRSVCAVTVAGDGAYRETPTTPQRPRWRRHPRPKPPPSLPLLCPERKHSASSQALSTIGGLSGFSRLILRLRG